MTDSKTSKWKQAASIGAKALPIAVSLFSGLRGNQEEKKANDYNQRALDQAEYDYNSRAPLRRQGMQALGQVEGAMDLGNIGFNAANPFAAARGPAASTATLGNWDRMTTDPETIDNAIMGATDDDLAWANKAMTAVRPDGSYAYKQSERNHAQKQILDPAKARAGYAGITPLFRARMARNAPARTSGIQALGAPARAGDPYMSSEG
jgi:hypothetical protein